jgi:translation initiation factor IF-3
VREVRVIADDGEQLGILQTDDALRRANEAGLDLVEVSPTARPPVCKIMDYGKFKYQQKRNAAQAKKKQHVVEVKEVKFRPKTDKHDFNVKMNRIQKFVGAGNKCKVTIMFRGREIVHPEIGQDILVRVGEALTDVAVVESKPRMEGRQMFMILAPDRSPKKKPDKPAAATTDSEEPASPAAPPAAGSEKTA